MRCLIKPKMQHVMRLPIEKSAWGLAEVNAEIQADKILIINGVAVDVDVERC